MTPPEHRLPADPPELDEAVGESPEAQRGYASEQAGFHKALSSRQLQMIAIGGAIGTGLFMGTGDRLHEAGPSVIFIFLICGFFAFLILRALGELVLHRPSSGSFVSYAREFLGEKAAFVAGWMYFLNWAMTGIVDATAAALYVQYWSAFTSVPQWILALIALAIVVGVNLLSVKVFGELEFWFALIKVVALVSFLVIGIVFLALGWPTDHGETGIPMVLANGGIFPTGVLPAIVMTQGVIFAYAGIELVGTAAGETQDPEKVMPKAINSVILRVAVFYVGSVLVLALLLPFTAYSGTQSPFVTFFSSIGSPETGAIAGTIMNLVVLTAALSSLNAGLYSTGRILHSMSLNGAAPRFTSRMSKQGVPYGGVLVTTAVALLGIGLNLVVPHDAFEIVLNVASLGIIASWATIMLCQIQLQRWAKQGRLVRPGFRLFGAPYTSYLTLAFLLLVLVLMAFDYPVGTLTIGSLAVIVPLLVVGWFVFRDRILAAAREREGLTGPAPVLAPTPRRSRDRRPS